MKAALLAALVLLALAGAALGLDRLYPPNLSRLEATGTEVLDRNGRLLAVLPAAGGVWRLRTSVDDVSRPFLNLLVHTEDRRFWQHPGVDPVAVVRAAAQWARAGRVVSGGSTLSMQAARLLEPRPRTLRSKLVEAARALQLEWHYGKRGVLGIWLTLAPMGGNLEGVRAGARAWFGTSAAALDPAQAALLVALPRRPEALRPDRHPEAAEQVRDRVLAEAEGVPVPLRRLPFPRHAAQALAGLRGGPTLRTTIDLPLQAALERSVAARLDTMPERASLAVLVADARSREIRALVSGRPGDEARAGALDLSRAVRSPGSALKPFLYQMAFEEGLARPDSVLTDLPRHFGAYAPENYLRGHAGRVSAAAALQRSLNLPALALLEEVGPLRFAERLRASGAKPLLPPGADPALPLALGGAGLTLRELAGLYAGLVAPSDAPLTSGPHAIATQAGSRRGRAPGRRYPDAALPRPRAAGDRLEDRHQLGRARRLGVRYRPRARGRRLGRPSGRHAAPRRDRARAGGADPRGRVRDPARRPASATAALRYGADRAGRERAAPAVSAA